MFLSKESKLEGDKEVRDCTCKVRECEHEENDHEQNTSLAKLRTDVALLYSD